MLDSGLSRFFIVVKYGLN